MGAPRQLVVREIELAYMLSFTDFDSFRRALKEGAVPPPSEYVKGKPVWFVADLERRYGAGIAADREISESDVLALIDKG